MNLFNIFSLNTLHLNSNEDLYNPFSHIKGLSLIVLFCFQSLAIFSQCNNPDFETGDLTGWTGTHGICASFGGDGPCSPSSGWPYLVNGFDQGPNDAALNSSGHHFMMTGGFDATVGGTILPTTYPNAGSKSLRLGSNVANIGNGRGETASYTFVVDASNSNFTYHYAVVLNDAGGGHTDDGQPYFKIKMTANGTDVPCANYFVSGNTAASIGGFTSIGGSTLWKGWSSVSIPLKDYIGQTVKITFETRNCVATISPGNHWAYAYIDAECGPLEIIPSAPAVCAGQTVDLTAPTGAASYSWTGPSGTAIVSGANSQVATVVEPGTYSVTMTTIGDSPCTYSLDVTMPENLAGGGNVSVNSANTCVGGSATLTASGGATYSWAPGGETTESIAVSPASTTTYTVTGYSATCGSGDAVATVNVNPIPTSPFTVTPACIDGAVTITYTGNASPTDTYDWNFGTGTVVSGSGQGPYTVSWSSSGSKNVSLTVTVGSCVSPPTTESVTIYPPPTITVTPTTVCIGSNGTISASGASTYVWDTGASGASLNDTPSSTTTYTVIGTDANGCTNTATGTITVNPLQDPSFSYNPATICKTGGSDPTPTITGAPGGSFSITGGVTINPSTGVVDLASTPLGNYTITYTTPGPCPDNTTFDIAIVDIPVADFTLGEYCQNEANPSPTYINGGSAGTFTSTAGLVFVNPVVTPGQVDLTASSTGNYTITNTVGGGGGCPQVVATNTITINAIPTTTVNNQTICNGDAATLTANGADTYLWSDGSSANTLTASPTSTTNYSVTGTTAGCSSTAVGTITVNPIPNTTVNNGSVCDGAPATVTASGADTYIWSNGTIGNSLTATPNTTTSYTVTGTSLGCSSDATSTISVNPIPTVSINNPVICQGNSATITPTGADTYLWSDGSTGNTLTVSPTTTTSYTVTGTSLGCSSDAVSTVTITLKPVVTVNNPAICIGESATLTASGGSTYDWQTGETGNSIIVSPTTTTTYTVGDNTPGCEGSTTATVTVNPLPTVTVNAQTICEGESSTLTAGGASTYVWNDGLTNNPKTVSPAIGVTTYTVTGTDVNGCVDSEITTVTVNPLPVVTANDISVCKGSSASLTANGANTYVWSNGASGAILTDSPSSTRTYTVTGTDVNNCSSTGIGTIYIIPTPTANFEATPQPAVVSYPTITFIDLSSVDVTYWHWDFGDGDTLAPSTSDPVHTYPGVEQSYDITLTVRNSLCSNVFVLPVIIGPEYSFFIPNAFSPNGDGENDTFNGKGVGIIEYNLSIFDRWGNFIFYSDSLDKGWDGTANEGNDPAQQDVYVWKVDLRDVFNKPHHFVGTVTLVKGD